MSVVSTVVQSIVGTAKPIKELAKCWRPSKVSLGDPESVEAAAHSGLRHVESDVLENLEVIFDAVPHKWNVAVFWDMGLNDTEKVGRVGDSWFAEEEVDMGSPMIIP
jgi:hypothetical protein